MKRSIISIVIFISVLLVLVFVTSFNPESSANAQVGNTGLIVRCVLLPDTYIAPNAQSELNCFAIDGTHFASVPDAHYLFVTDVSVAPFSG